MLGLRYRILIFPAFAFIVLLVYLPRWVTHEPEVHPLTRSWDIAVPNQGVPAGLTSLSSKECGACHQQHYAEWQLSTHSLAWKDPQFQAEISKESSPFMCINCHIPLQNQQEYIVTGLIDGDIYQPVKRETRPMTRSCSRKGLIVPVATCVMGQLLALPVLKMPRIKLLKTRNFFPSNSASLVIMPMPA